MSRRPAVLLTGVGKRYDIVSSFARHAFVVAADPSPLAPAQYAADVRVAPPRADDPGYVPFLTELVERHGVSAIVPLTDLDLEVLARSDLPAFVPEADVCRARRRTATRRWSSRARARARGRSIRAPTRARPSSSPPT